MSSSPASSTLTLLPTGGSPPPQPKKDYAAAFASLQSSYGASGHAPVLPTRDTFIPVTSESKSPKNTSWQHRWRALFHDKGTKGDSHIVKGVERDAPEDSETSADSHGAQADVARAESGASLSSNDQRKDFQTAFASLQTSYGMGAPVVGISR